jgi:hypothetical protein
MPFHSSLHLDGLPFSSTWRPQPARIQSPCYPVQRPDAGRSNLEYDRKDIRGELVGLSCSDGPRLGLGDTNIRSIAELDTTAFCRRQGGPRPLRNHFPLMLGDRTEDVDSQLVSMRRDATSQTG